MHLQVHYCHNNDYNIVTEIKNNFKKKILSIFDKIDNYMIENNKRTVKYYEFWAFVKASNITYDDLFNRIQNKLES